MSERLPQINPADQLNGIIQERQAEDAMIDEALTMNQQFDAETQARVEAARIDNWVGNEAERKQLSSDELKDTVDSMKQYLASRPEAVSNKPQSAFHVKDFSGNTINEQFNITDNDTYDARLSAIKALEVRKMRAALKEAEQGGLDFEVADIQKLIDQKIAESQKLDESKVDPKALKLLAALKGETVTPADDDEVQNEVESQPEPQQPESEAQPEAATPDPSEAPVTVTPRRRRTATPFSATSIPDLANTPSTVTVFPVAQPPLAAVTPDSESNAPELENAEDSEDSDEQLSEGEKALWNRLTPGEQAKWSTMNDDERAKVVDRLLDADEVQKKQPARNEKKVRGLAARTRRASKLLGRLTRPTITGEAKPDNEPTPEFDEDSFELPTNFFETQALLEQQETDDQRSKLFDDLVSMADHRSPEFTDGELDTDFKKEPQKAKVGRTLGRSAIKGLVGKGLDLDSKVARGVVSTGRRLKDARKKQ